MKNLSRVAIGLVVVLVVAIFAAKQVKLAQRRAIAERGLARSLTWKTEKTPGGRWPFRVLGFETCDFGDLDAIGMDLALDDTTPLILSLEAYGGASPPSFVEVSADAISGRGWHGEISFRPPDQPTVYFLGLCRDRTGKGSCMAKEILSPTDLVVKNTVSAGEGAKVPVDRTYWFSTLLATRNDVTFPVTDIPPGGEPQWLEFLSSEPRVSVFAEDLLPQLAKHYAVLRPSGLRFAAKEWQILLPFRKKILCATKKESR